MDVICCVCHRVKTADGEFEERDVDIAAWATHTYCETCMVEELTRQGQHDILDRIIERRRGRG